MCRCTRAVEKTIKRVSGNTVGPEEAGVRLPSRPWTRWAEAVSGTVRRHSANGRLYGLRSDRRTEHGTCRLYHARSADLIVGRIAVRLQNAFELFQKPLRPIASTA